MREKSSIRNGNIDNFVNGEFVSTGKSFENLHPVDGSLVGNVSEADEALVDRAVQSARSALDGPWGELSVPERGECLRRVAARIEKRFDEFVDAEIADTGKPRAQARSLDIPRGAANFRIFADLLQSRAGEVFETAMQDGTRAINYSVHKPLGVVAVISPWNLPLLLTTWKLAPALACGNAVVVKPSEETPSSTTLLAEVALEAGIPRGVFNVVHGYGPGSAGEFLTNHPAVDAITFTGESRTGTAIMKAAADTVKEISFELGGKNAAVVFEDADFERAVEGVARSTFTNCGQVCLCSERVYVHRSLFDEFVDALKGRAEALTLGAPDDEGVDMGPLISRQHREKVLSYYQLAREEGARVVTGGGVPRFGDYRDNGSFVEPTIVTDLAETARCQREEVFGPFCHVSAFDDEDEVITMVNDSDYGLACALWTESLQRAHRVAPRIEAGVVWVNTWFLRDLRTAFGGVKRSGIGREGGRYSLDFYSDVSNICIRV